MWDCNNPERIIVSQLTLFLNKIEGFSEFIIANKPTGNLLLYLESFKRNREQSKPFTSNENLMFSMAKEKVYDLQKLHTPKILFYDSSLAIDESIIDQFRTDFNYAKTGRYAFKDAERQHYKTFTETYKFDEVKDNGIILKYANAEHPLIYSELGRAIFHSGAYSVSLDFIIRTFKFFNSVPNIYWHSPYGLFGCWQSLWFLGYLLKDKLKQLDASIYMKYFKLLFLYMSRAIAIGEKLQLDQPIDIYRNRGELLRTQRESFMTIFSEKGYLASIMDIQYISDCYLSYLHASKLGFPGLGEQALNDSRKMYTYGSLSNVGYDDNGYKWIEDCTWSECVEKGRARSIDVASKLVEDFENGKLSFSIEEWKTICKTIFANYNVNQNVHYNWHNP